MLVMSIGQRVVLVASRYVEWETAFAEMADIIHGHLRDSKIEHIGSTAVPDLPAKDVVDLLIGVEAGRVLDVTRQLASEGFDHEGGHPHHCWLSFPSRSDRKYVLHVVEFDGVAWQRRIAFRDLLRRDEAARAKYLEVKLSAARVAQGWDDYTRSKDAVVAGLLADNVS